MLAILINIVGPELLIKDWLETFTVNVILTHWENYSKDKKKCRFSHGCPVRSFKET